ncbi:glycoside hydrolase family 9 protein [Nocardioides sp.]|uniref:glycoside hydrolase family 9 protein n=1 Tax=Nocardioides sp. TaxID=35761 RepID=UPI002F41AE34
MRRAAVVPLGATLAALLAAGLVTALPAGPALPQTAPAPGPAQGRIRVNQQGYLPGEPKQARLMTTAPVHDARYLVTDHAGHVVLRGRVPQHSAGSWNARFPAVYRLGLSRLHTPGRYRVATSGDVTTHSPWFRVRGAGDIFGKILRAGVAFDRNQRDGARVVAGPLHRRPSHLHDRQASIYRWPRMERGSDLILDRRLHRIGGPVDVSGGWFDAGDYLKFTHSTAYNDVLLFSSARMLGSRAPSRLVAEARVGLHWLMKMWDAKHRSLLIQVGIGSGNRAGTFRGDHDLWRLPQADDRDTRHADRFVSHRPVFRAAPPGHPISPNLVGRVSAAFALAAQQDAGSHPERARRDLRQARLLYARAATKHPPHPLVTALPHAFYPESTWRDDMQLGAAEIALASHRLGQPAARYVRESALWAHGFIAEHSTDTLNLYDTAALADSALADALGRVPHGRLAVSRADLVTDLRHQIHRGIVHSRHDPFGAAEPVDEFDANSHTFGLIATVALYDRLTHSRRFQGFASLERTWLLGGDPWGVTAMVGVGHTFPLCMQHQVANLSGTLDGTPPIDVGAVVNGPNGKGNFDGGLGGFQTGMRHCTAAARTLERFDGHGSRYVDDVRSWQTDEPALDMTGAAVIAAAAQLRLHPHAGLGR